MLQITCTMYTIITYPLPISESWTFLFSSNTCIWGMSILQSCCVSYPGFIYRRLLTKMTLLNQDVLVINMKTSWSSQITNSSVAVTIPSFFPRSWFITKYDHHILQMGSTRRVRLVKKKRTLPKQMSLIHYLLRGTCCSFFRFPCSRFWPIIYLFVFFFIVLFVHSTIYSFWLPRCNLLFFSFSNAHVA